jgi:hypothetical protein
MVAMPASTARLKKVLLGLVQIVGMSLRPLLRVLQRLAEEYEGFRLMRLLPGMGPLTDMVEDVAHTNDRYSP